MGQVKVRVLQADLERGNLLLSMKEDRSSTLRAFESVDASTWLSGKVTALAEDGAFVAVQASRDGPSTDGFLHVTDLEGDIDYVEDVLQVGERVEVRVASVDLAAGQVRLSTQPVPPVDRD